MNSEKEEKLPKNIDSFKEPEIDLEISKEYLKCLKKEKSHRICKDLFEIFNKPELKNDFKNN